MTRSRFDVYPPVNATPTGTHSAVIVPNRPAQVRGNTKNRPAYVWLTDENGGCPLNYARMMSIESEIVPIMVGAFAIPDNRLDDCLDQANTEPNGQPRPRGRSAESQSDGVQEPRLQRLVRPRHPRHRHLESADAARSGLRDARCRTASRRTYPVFRDGLIYWVDNRHGTARRAGTRGRARNELPGPGSGVYEGNATSPHR